MAMLRTNCFVAYFGLYNQTLINQQVNSQPLLKLKTLIVYLYALLLFYVVPR